MTDYFFHDVNASSDEKLQELRMEMKCQGIGIYWSLIELLKQNDGRMNYKPALLAYSIRGCTTEEVERVITGFDLFEVQDGQFWSESLLRRIEMQEEATAKKTAAARKAGNASAEARKSTTVEQPLNDRATTVEQPLNDRATDVEPNKLINKSINFSLSEGAPAREREGEDRERDLIFLRFFFKNFKNPAGEMERYWDNYAGQGWKTSKGAAIEDKVAYCSGWKPLDPSPRFGKNALTWYEKFYNDAAPDFKDPLKLLTDLTEIVPNGGETVLRYSTKSTGQKVANWLISHGGYAAVAVQVATKKQPTPNPLP